VTLRVVSPGVAIDRPWRSAALAAAPGSTAGFAIGAFEGHALSRAREAEDDRDFLAAMEVWLRKYDDPDVTTVTNGRAAVAELDRSAPADGHPTAPSRPPDGRPLSPP
jgi:hypothetical protein